MKTATILPTHYLNMIKEEPYHMCLAHLIGVDKEYTEFYKEVGRYNDKYLIMDNGVIEGDRRPIQEIIKKALLVKANEIILPDAFMEMEETLELSYSALQIVRNDFPDLKVMAVPQGKTMDEWLDCAQAMIDWDIQCLGIPKVLTKIAGRDGRLNALTFLGNKLRGLDVHLLGCWTTPLEATLIEKAVQSGLIRPVRGIDSAIAWVYSKDGTLICDSDRPAHIHVDFKDRWTNQQILQKNIEMWKAACEIANDDVMKLFM